MSTVLAFHTFDATRVWFSYRSSPGVWTLSSLYTDDAATTISGLHGEVGATVSAGIEIEANASNPRGFLAYGSSFPNFLMSRGRPWFIGQGLPATAYPIEIDNLPFPSTGTDKETDNLNYWDMAHGAYWIGSSFWAIIQYYDATTFFHYLAAVQSTTYDSNGIPTLWHNNDASNAPYLHPTDKGCAIRWDGVSNFINVFAQNSGSNHIWSLYTFNFTTKTWSPPTGTIDMGRVIYPSHARSATQIGYNGNGIFRFPNGDIGVFYSDEFKHNCYYRLWNGTSWGSEVVVKAYTGMDPVFVGQVIPDPTNEKLHVFTVGIDTHWHGTYHIVTHGGTVTANCFTFPDRVASDGFGRGLILGSEIFVPWDSFDETTSNSVWVGTNTGGTTTFVEEFLPKPAIEAGQVPSCAYLIHYISTGQSFEVDGTSSFSFEAVEIEIKFEINGTSNFSFHVPAVIPPRGTGNAIMTYYF